MRYSNTTIFFLTVLLSVAAAGCSGSGKSVADSDTRDLEDYIDNINQYEDFDETEYIDPPPVTGEVIEHDVPVELLSGSASNDSRTYQTVQGFRIQLHSSLDKEGAVAAEEKAKEWWRTLPTSERSEAMAGSTLPVYLKYAQPYYRVRVGNFATRDEAEIALEIVSHRFPRAFIVVDRVTVLR